MPEHTEKTNPAKIQAGASKTIAQTRGNGQDSGTTPAKSTEPAAAIQKRKMMIMTIPARGR